MRPRALSRWRSCALLLVLTITPFATAPARAPATPAISEARLMGEADGEIGRHRQLPARSDTLWFGGDDGQGRALFSPELPDPDDAAWTWDSGANPPCEGWSTRDMSVFDEICFARVTAEDFSGDPCVPMFPGEVGEIWIGVHEADADAWDWFGGMGYGNDFCQRALSPYVDCPGQHAVSIDWKMYLDSEPDYDYAHLYVLAYDGADPPELLEEIALASLSGSIGSPSAPATRSEQAAGSALPAATEQVRIEFRFTSDGGWSDEDGEFLSDCGPFAADEIVLLVEGQDPHSYDFESDAEGWSFAVCEGIGAFMAVWPEEVWSDWLQTVGVGCCTLSGNALGCVDPDSPLSVPGHPRGHYESMQGGLCVIDRDLYPSDEYNTAFAQYDGYFYLRHGSGAFYRVGFTHYPYSSPQNPQPHWSPRLGGDVWAHGGLVPFCLNDARVNLTAGGLPDSWEQMRLIFEVACDCESFGILPGECDYEGETYGSPLFDNVRVGVYLEPGPVIALASGHLFHDGFGQNFPYYLEPGDAGNSNVSFDNSRDDIYANDMHADSAMIMGPMPAGRPWLCRLVFKVETKGPRQDLIPGYHVWKSRLMGDPETGFVKVLMDSAQATPTLVSDHAFATYFHEDDPGFRGPRSQDYNELNEILPDGVFVPGTTIRYYYSSFWCDTPEMEGFYGADPDGWEFQILPGMRLVEGSDWEVEWPSVLYVDEYNRGAEASVQPLLEQLGLESDRYDALDRAGCFNAPMLRSHKHGAWGNNGCTVEQLLGYRLVLVNTGDLGAGAIPDEDFELLEAWLAASACPEAACVRRGLLLNGDRLPEIMDHPEYGVASEFLRLTLGASYLGPYESDESCALLAPSGGPITVPEGMPCVFGMGCPTFASYDLLGVHPTSDPPAVGRLDYARPEPPYERASFAEVVRAGTALPAGNWRSVVDGFSWHHVSVFSEESGCHADSASVVAGAAGVLGPAIAWIADVSDPFVPWRYPCEDAAVEETPDGHLSGAVNFLHVSRPNPFRDSATIRFHLARDGQVDLRVFDVTGRLVRTLVDGEMKAGETSLVWDGTDDGGARVSGGVYWMQMSAGDFVSSKRMIALR